MRKALVAVAALAFLAAPAASRAQEEAAAPAEGNAAAPAQEEAAAPAQESAAAPAEESAASHEEKGEAKHGLQLKLGLGAGYGLPMGYVKGNEKLSEIYSGEIPIELEVSYKFTHAISAGVYAGYGLGLVSKEVDAMGMSASDHLDSIASWRFGVQGEYELGKLGPAVPFAALRVGYVMENIAHKGGGTEKASGFEYLTAIVGADFEITESFGVGPFVSYALGQYAAEAAPGASSESIPSAERAMHEWLTIGLRGAFTL